MLEIYFETYGCTANYNSTELMKGLCKQAGLNITNSEDYADIIIINSCIVKAPTEEKIRRRIQDLIKKFPKKKIIIAGCIPSINKKFFQEYQEKNIYLLNTNNVKNIVNLIKEIYEGNYEAEKYLKRRNELKLNLPKIPKENYIGITQISEGCLGECSYCIVRLAKGKLFSYPKDKVLESINSDLNSGCKEIWLTSQDNASYGNEENKFLLPSLLSDVLKINKRFFIRVGMMNPNNVLKILSQLLEIYEDKKIYKFLHIPIQSGSDRILKSMNRKYTKKDVLEIVNSFREKFPDMHISTDFIVGYPGETEEDFQETLELVKIINPETLNFSKFWPRKGTPAEKLEELSPELIRDRIIRISNLHKELCLENQKKFLGKEAKVFVDQKGLGDFPDTYLARDENYKLYAVQTKEKILGKNVNVKVTKTTPHYLISERII